MGIKRFLSNLGLLGGGRSAKGPSVEVVNSSITYYLRPLKGLKRVLKSPQGNQNELLFSETCQFWKDAYHN